MNVEELKSLQSEIIKKNRTCNLIGIFLFLIVVAIIISISIINGIPEFSFVFLFIAAIFSILITFIIKGIVNGKNIETFNNNFKKLFVLKALEKSFSDLKYKTEGFNEDFISKTGMIDLADSYESNDYVSGQYKDIKFEQADVHIQERHEETDSDGDTRTVWVTIFEGRIMVFDFNKPFKSNIQIVSRGFSASSFWNKKVLKVSMEDINFNKNFTVFAESEHEAFYILTPNFMEKIQNVSQKLNCSTMFGFLNSKLLVAIDNREDSFEYNPLKVINEQDIENNIQNDIKVITDLVDDLNLDNDLFRKEG